MKHALQKSAEAGMGWMLSKRTADREKANPVWGTEKRKVNEVEMSLPRRDRKRGH